MKKLLIFIALFCFQHAYADIEVSEFKELFSKEKASKKLAFSHYGLSLYDNESVLDKLSNCEELKGESLYTHLCEEDKVTYALKLNESKVCNKDFERGRLRSESMSQMNDRLEALRFNYCLVAFRIFINLKESELKRKIEEISINYGPPSDQLNQVKRPDVLNSLEPLVLDQTFIWDHHGGRNEINPDEIDTDYVKTMTKVQVFRDEFSKGRPNKYKDDSVVKVRITVFLKDAYKEARFDAALWFQWTISLLIPLVYIVLTTSSIKNYMKTSFKNNAGKFHYMDKTFRRYKTMYIVPAVFQLFVNIGGFLTVGMVFFVFTGGGIEFCRLLTPGFCEAINQYSGNYQLLMLIAVLYTLQIIVLLYYARRLGKKYLFQRH